MHHSFLFLYKKSHFLSRVLQKRQHREILKDVAILSDICLSYLFHNKVTITFLRWAKFLLKI